MSIRRKVVVGTVLILLLVGLAVFFLGPALFASIAYPLPEEYRASVNKWSREYCQGINEPQHLISAMIMVESGWRKGARSNAGAIGMTQFIPSTAVAVSKRLGVSPFTPSDLTRDSDLSIRFGAYYICARIKDYGGSVQKGLLAYNGGGAAVNALEGGRPYNLSYASKVMAIARAYKEIYGAWYENGVPAATSVSTVATPSSTSANSEFNVQPRIVGSVPIVSFWQGLLSSQDTNAPVNSEEDGALTSLWKIFVPGN